MCVVADLSWELDSRCGVEEQPDCRCDSSTVSRSRGSAIAMVPTTDCRICLLTVECRLRSGQLQSTVTCGGCGTLSHCFEDFLDLSLPIPAGRVVSIQVCLGAVSVSPAHRARM